MAEDDPFSVFGESDSDDEAATNPLVQQMLVQETNRRMQEQKEAGTSTTVNQQHVGNASNLDRKDEIYEPPHRLELPWPSPLYLGPMACVQSLPVGGGRGWVATRALPPGTLLLVEEPLILWHDPVLDDLSALPLVLPLASLLDHLHPTKHECEQEWSGVTPPTEQISGMMERLRDDHADSLADLLQALGDESSFSEDDLLRLQLTLRYNGLQSGVYLHTAMFNHSETPNVVKFFPNHPRNSYSEVRTTRSVAAGEALHISYLPTLLSHASRRHHLWTQHRFDIGASVPDDDDLRSMELVKGQLPRSFVDHVDASAVTTRIEASLDELEPQVVEGDLARWQALEIASLELYREAFRQLGNERHVLLLRCLRLHLDCCDRTRLDESLTPRQRMELLGRVVASAKALVTLQTQCWGKDHYELATTHLEVAEAMNELLSLSPTQTQVEGIKSITEMTTLEYQHRKEHIRIRALYPEDTEELIARS